MKPDPLTLPNCAASGKLSLPNKRLPPELRASSKSHRGKKNTKYISTYKCKKCPYYHQTSGS